MSAAVGTSRVNRFFEKESPMFRWKAYVALFLTSLVVLSTAASTHAQWNPVKQVQNAGKRLEKSVRTEAGNAASSVKRAHGLNYAVRIVNPKESGSRFIFYDFDGQTQIGLPGGTVRTHRGTMVGKPTIAFDNGRGQRVRYALSDATYEFTWTRGVLNLHRR
jgi:hypothetical protein